MLTPLQDCMGLIDRSVNTIAILFVISFILSLIFLVPEVLFALVLLLAIVAGIILLVIYEWNQTIKSDGENIVFKY